MYPSQKKWSYRSFDCMCPSTSLSWPKSIPKITMRAWRSRMASCSASSPLRPIPHPVCVWERGVSVFARVRACVCVWERARDRKRTRERVCTGWRRLIGCLKLQVLLRKEPLIIGIFCGKWPMKIRHLMTLRHPVCVCSTLSLSHPIPDRVCVCVCVTEKERARERERERTRNGERVCVCVCMQCKLSVTSYTRSCVWERDREREG